MSSRRFFHEVIVFLGTVSGAAIGYCAGANAEPVVQLVCAFVGFSVVGGFTDFCLRGGK